jgi:hypothetical protein
MPLMEHELQAASNGLRGVFACPFLAELRRVKSDVVMPLFKSFSNTLSERRRLLTYRNSRGIKRLSGRSDATNGTSALSEVEWCVGSPIPTSTAKVTRKTHFW